MEIFLIFIFPCCCIRQTHQFQVTSYLLPILTMHATPFSFSTLIILLLFLCVKAAASLNQMLEEAKKYIPQQKWATTPVALKATAGLRMLPENDANAIIEEVSKTGHTRYNRV